MNIICSLGSFRVIVRWILLSHWFFETIPPLENSEERRWKCTDSHTYAGFWKDKKFRSKSSKPAKHTHPYARKHSWIQGRKPFWTKKVSPTKTAIALPAGSPTAPLSGKCFSLCLICWKPVRVRLSLGGNGYVAGICLLLSSQNILKPGRGREMTIFWDGEKAMNQHGLEKKGLTVLTLSFSSLGHVRESELLAAATQRPFLTPHPLWHLREKKVKVLLCGSQNSSAVDNVTCVTRNVKRPKTQQIWNTGTWESWIIFSRCRKCKSDHSFSPNKEISLHFLGTCHPSAGLEGSWLC